MITGGTFTSGATPILATIGGPVGIATAATSSALIAGGTIAAAHGIVLHKNYDKLSRSKENKDLSEMNFERAVKNFDSNVSIKLTQHAKSRMKERGIKKSDILYTIQNNKPIKYYHDGKWKVCRRNTGRFHMK